MQVPVTYSCDPFVQFSFDRDHTPNVVTGITPAIPLPTSLDETLTMTMSYTVDDGPIQTKVLTFMSKTSTSAYSSTGFRWDDKSGGPTTVSHFVFYDSGDTYFRNNIWIETLDEDADTHKFQCVSLSINGEPVTPRSN